MQSQLRDYLSRIGYDGPTEASLACLTSIHRQMAFTVPYETLDIQLGRPLNRDVSHVFERVVNRKRGGWCFELHDLLVWALHEIGFNARLVTAAIHRREKGHTTFGNHTAILVDLDRTYLADLGLGDGIRNPIPLEEGTFDQGRLKFQLERTCDDYWRFINHALAFPTNFDFRDEPVDDLAVEKYSLHYQTAPDSLYVQNLICQIMQEETVTCLTGRVLRQKSPDGTTKRLVMEDEFEEVLAGTFGIRDAAVKLIWPKVAARHRELFGDAPIDEVSVTGL